jgi:acetyl-CoA acetyltransferase
LTVDDYKPLRDRCAIVGVGATKMSRNSERSALSLATEAALAAVSDAGLGPDDVEGIVNSELDTVAPYTLAAAIGARNMSFWGQAGPGGVGPSMMIQHAVGAVLSGAAKAVLCVRALNGRSEARYGVNVPGIGEESVGGFSTYDEFFAPYGLLTPGQTFALATQRHMEQFGTTQEQLGSVALACREAANADPSAQMHGRPLTMDDYLASRMISTPLRLFDFCLETDGACALVITSAERARDMPRHPVLIRAVAGGMAPDARVGMMFPVVTRSDMTDLAARRAGERLWSRAGVSPSEVSTAQLYDCFTISVILHLEAYGFCDRGEGGPFAESGAINKGGRLPINTSGGHLSGGYIHGMNLIVEAVRQLRGEAANQVPGAELALCTGAPFPVGSSALLRRA